MHMTGFVVVARQPAHTTQPAPRGRVRAPHPQWTLHTEDCRYVQKETIRRKLPAPAVAYPGTVPCKACKPTIAKEAGNGKQ